VIWFKGEEGGTGACVRCEEAGTRPSARVGLAMSVFTHGVTTKGKPRLINHNQVFTVVSRRKMLRRLPSGAMASSIWRVSQLGAQSVLEATYRSG
jgi:hypothetical protein